MLGPWSTDNAYQRQHRILNFTFSSVLFYFSSIIYYEGEGIGFRLFRATGLIKRVKVIDLRYIMIQGVRAASHVHLVVAELCCGTPCWKDPTPELDKKFGHCQLLSKS